MTKSVLGPGSPRTVYAASTGGHLAQLVRLSQQFETADDPLWITFDSPQSRSLLAGRRVEYVGYIPSRGYRQLMLSTRQVYRILRREKFEVCVSTGSALALAALPVSILLGKRSSYIESISRFSGPSLSGKILARLPGIQTFTQHQSWAGGKWTLGPSVLGSYVVDRHRQVDTSSRLKIFVTVGTISPYRFDSLVLRLSELLSNQHDVIWQLGESYSCLVEGQKFSQVSAEEFDRFVVESDVVISHSGVGSALRILELGKQPVLVPRRAVRGEHVDDHQVQVASALGDIGVVEYAEVADLTMDRIWSAAGKVVQSL